MKKSTITEIKERFDADVERFSNVETGQVATVDAKLSLELMTSAARAVRPKATHLLDLGCGAGNYTIAMLAKIPDLNCTLIDLSLPMLEKAKERTLDITKGKVESVQGDIRAIELPSEHFDIILAGAVLHHLRDDEDWEFVFTKLFKSLKKGGCLFISDLIIQDNPAINDLIWQNYAEFLTKNGGSDYQQKVFGYIEKEDSPRSMTFQLDLMRKVGFERVEILHKNMCFGAFGGMK